MTVVDSFFEGNIRSLSKIISFVEDKQDGYQDLLGRLYSHVGHSLRIGITGPPGAGKSTIVNGLARQFLSQGKKVGVIAVDPTSPFTGGALLGDRVRLSDLPTDGRFFFRSMATRGATGGLAEATGNATVIYDAFGFDITLIETVGVGQVELDVVDACDSVVVVIVPESGDAVQTMKAGLMEIADTFCVNKADRPGAEQLVADLRYALRTFAKPKANWKVPVLATEAVNGKNIPELREKIEAHIQAGQESGDFEAHRNRQLKKKILNIIKSRFQRDFLERLSSEMEFDQVVNGVLSGDTNPYKISEELYRQFFPC
jgi:LAO/AO transport system kinase